MKIFITGIDSFTGKYLYSYLQKRGYSVCGSSLKEDNFYRCNITDKKKLLSIIQENQPEVIIHLAAISFVGHRNSEEFYRINTIGSENVLEAAKECGVKKCILASSSTVYGNQPITKLHEKLSPNPSNHYALSKYASEQLAKEYKESMNIIITRPFNYTGKGQNTRFLVPKIVEHFKRKASIIELGNLNIQREFNDIYFVCEAYRRLLHLDISTTLNIASGRTISIQMILKWMEEISSHHIKVKQNPVFIRKNEIYSLCGDPSYMEHLIGKIEHKPFIETLRDMYEDRS